MPADTPRTICGVSGPMAVTGGSGLVGVLDREQPVADLAQRDRQRLLLDPGLDQRAHVLQQALAELGVVSVDLARPLRGHDHELVLAVHDVEKIVDRRVDDAIGGGSPYHVTPFMFEGRHRSSGEPNPKVTSCSHTSWTEVLTSVRSNSPSAASSSRAASSRRSMTSGGSVPRPVSRRTSSSQDGGARNTSRASGMVLRTCRAPARSISSSAGMPAASFSSSGFRGVPYLFPANSAHTSSSPSATIRPNSASSTKKYSRPSSSPGRGERVVAETESHSSGWQCRNSATTVLFPTPEGPESTVSRENFRMVRQYPLPGPAAPLGVAESPASAPDRSTMPPYPLPDSAVFVCGPAQMSEPNS